MSAIMDYLTNDEVMQEFGARMRAKRLEHNLPLDQLAVQAGLNRKTVMELEAGGDVRLSTLVKVLRVMNMLPRLDGLLPDTLPGGQALSARGTVRQKAYRPERS